jgi:preprotein translocase subunit SecE
MALNREQKRMLQRQGEVGPDGEPVRSRRTPAPRANNPKEKRTGPRQFFREVQAELRKVAWPTKAETINYSVVVIITLVVVTALIFAVDWVFSDLVLRLFDPT